MAYFSIEERALHILLMKSYGLRNLGLLSGKMGISLSFLLTSIKTKQSVFEEYAFDLLDQITDEVNQYTPLGLDSGLAGIGWGLEYIIQNKFAEGDNIDICEDIDRKIMQIDPRRINDLSLETGLEGLLHYVLLHLQGALTKDTVLPFDTHYLKDLYDSVCAIPFNRINKQMSILIKSYKDFFKKKDTIHYNADLSIFVENAEVHEDELKTFPLGLRYGLAGYIIKNGK